MRVHYLSGSAAGSDAAPEIATNVSALSVECVHCGSALTSRSPKRESPSEPAFCCLGCQTVYGILKAKGLSRYYDLKEACAPIRSARPVEVSGETYGYLDDPEFQALYAWNPESLPESSNDTDGTTPPAPGSARGMRFYLEGVHCVACLWLVEKLPEFVPEVSRAELDLGKSVATIVMMPGAKVAPVARELELLGYRPHPVRREENTERLQKREDRSWLVRIGVAGASAGNIMLMAIPLYAGAGGAESVLFKWASLALFLPAFFFSATPFFRSAASAIRTARMSIDVPIVLAIVLGFVVSVLNLLRGSEHIYFDSLAALIFLLLSSRFALRRIQQNAVTSSHLLTFLAPSRANRVDASSRTLEEVPIQNLRLDDIIEVGSGEMIPADGILVLDTDRPKAGAYFISQALLTGEAAPQAVRAGDTVYSGTENHGDPIRIRVTATGVQSRIGSILRQAEEAGLRKAQIVELADKVSKVFLALVIFGAAALFFATPGLDNAINRALALIIVTCPCALALATPLALSLSLAKAARAGILIKGPNALEKLSQVETVFLDKTGTLTTGTFQVLDWKHEGNAKAETDELAARRAAYTLELRSRHPIAKAIVKHLHGEVSAVEVTDFREELGKGVSGTINSQHFELRACDAGTAGTGELAGLLACVGVYRDSKLLATITLGDRIRDESAEAVEALRKLGVRPRILSGDNATAVHQVAAALSLESSEAIDSASPEFKRDVVAAAGKALMIGDGANDAVALSSAFVGAAVHGSVELSLRTADIYLANPGVMPVVRLIEVSRETMHVIRRNLVFSLVYNALGAAAAITGYMNPLFAAILMPASALTVFGSSVWGTRKLRRGLR